MAKNQRGLLARTRFVVGNRISRLGEAVDSHRLIYNPLQFRNFHDAALRHAPIVMDAFTELIPEASSYLDVGAGSGAFAAEAMRRGKRTVALEHGAAGRALAVKQGVDARPLDLTQPPASVGSFDLAFSLEVAEHLPPELGTNLVRFMVGSANVIVFTAGQPGQRGTGHINLRPKAAWVEDFEAEGVHYDEALAQALSQRFEAGGAREYLVNNVIAFRR